MENLFLRALVAKLRFPSSKGFITLEDLFDLPLTDPRKESLNKVYKRLTSQRNKDLGDSLPCVEENSENSQLNLQIQVVNKVSEYRKKVMDTAAKAQATKDRNAKIRLLIEDKKEEAMKNLSVEELEAMLS